MNIAIRIYRYLRYDMCLFYEYDKDLYNKYAMKEVREVNIATTIFAVVIIGSTTKVYNLLNWYLYGAKIVYLGYIIRNPEMYNENEKMFNMTHKVDYKGNELSLAIAEWLFFVVIYSFTTYLRSRRANVKVSEGLAKERSMSAPLYVHNGNIIVDNHGYIVSPVVIGENSKLFINSGDLNKGSLQNSLDAVSNFVAKSDNAEAQQLWDSFNEEINGKGRKSVLKSTWNGVVNILPDVAKLAEAAAEIGKIFV